MLDKPALFLILFNSVIAAGVLPFSFKVSAYNKIISANLISIQSCSGPKPPSFGNLTAVNPSALIVTALLKSVFPVASLASKAAFKSASTGKSDFESSPTNQFQKSDAGEYSSTIELDICVA